MRIRRYFQAKLDELLGDIKEVKIYIYNIL